MPQRAVGLRSYGTFFLGPGANGEKFDPFSINGANHWYDVGAHRVRAVMNDRQMKPLDPAGCALLAQAVAGRWKASWMKQPIK